MARGGRRHGAGRRVGAATKKTRQIAEQALAEGKSPLEILLKVSRDQMEIYEADPKNAQAATAAANAAKDAAPYVHARMGNTDAPVILPEMTGSLAEKGDAVMTAVSRGRITPDQGVRLMSAIASQARIIEVDELERRIAALEEKGPK